MDERCNEKIKEIQTFMSELQDMLPIDFEEYCSDLKTKAACERYFEKIVEAVVDLTFLIIKHNSFPVPEDDKQALDILAIHNIITPELAEKLKDAKGMRNVLVHQYGVIDDEKVFHAVKEELEGDVMQFLQEVEDNL